MRPKWRRVSAPFGAPTSPFATVFANVLHGTSWISSAPLRRMHCTSARSRAGVHHQSAALPPCNSNHY